MHFARFVSDPDRMEAVLEEPYILIHEKKVSNTRSARGGLSVWYTRLKTVAHLDYSP